MPSQRTRAKRKQVTSSIAQSTQAAQAKQDVEAILARPDRQRRPCSQPHYQKEEGYTPHVRKEYESGTIIVAGPMYGKTRPAIVVTQSPNSFLAIPILTYKGKGLKDKDPREKAEHMSICDQREGGWYMKQNDMPALLTDQDMRGTLLKPESVVHFTDPFDFLYDHKTLILGKLCEYSTQTLLERYRRSVTKPPCLVRDPWPK
jgi:hypothetical protein